MEQFPKDLPRKNKLSFESLCPGLLSLSLQEEIVCICILFIYFAAANWNAKRYSAIFFMYIKEIEKSFLIYKAFRAGRNLLTEGQILNDSAYMTYL